MYLALAVHRAVVARDDDVGEVEAMQKGRSPRPAPKLMSERQLLPKTAMAVPWMVSALAVRWHWGDDGPDTDHC